MLAKRKDEKTKLLAQPDQKHKFAAVVSVCRTARKYTANLLPRPAVMLVLYTPRPFRKICRYKTYAAK